MNCYIHNSSKYVVVILPNVFDACDNFEPTVVPRTVFLLHLVMCSVATDELRSTLEEEHQRTVTELEQSIADVKRQHTKSGLAPPVE